MCTITYIPVSPENKEFFVTDNRDEAINRPTEWPRVYREMNTQLFYPKDKRAGGTWIGLSHKKRLMALMNGAFSSHSPQLFYRKSRGVVVKELLASPSLNQAIQTYDFSGIEQFYGIIFSWEKVLVIRELVWDGAKVYLRRVDESQPKIWSSMMSYSKEQHAMRERIFANFLADKKAVSPDSVWNFHHIKKYGEKEGVRIDRGAFRTTSISQFYHAPSSKDCFRFGDLLTGKEGKQQIEWD